jgi:hypothetical protein
MVSVTRRGLGAICGVALAPGRWLERTRGRRRLGLALVYGLIVACAASFGWRASRLRGLPDLGEPVDTRALRALRIPEDRNAFVLYAQASARAKLWDHVERKYFTGSYLWPTPEVPELAAYMKDNAEALELWRQGCERDEALCTPLSEIAFDSRLVGLSEHRNFCRMALMEASRCRAAGDVAGAWRWYRSALRGSRLIGRHATAVGMLIGAAEYQTVRAGIAAWKADSRVDARLLRRALDDVLAINALSAPLSETLEVEYLATQRSLGDPQWLIKSLADNPLDVKDAAVDRKAWYTYLPIYWKVRWFLGNEPECSRRLTNLAFANWLAESDRPPSQRARRVGRVDGTPLFYDVVPARGAPSAEALAARVARNLHARSVLTAYGSILGGYDRDRAQRAALVMSLADALYTLQHGQPPRSPKDLIGTCLAGFPEGYIAHE